MSSSHSGGGNPAEEFLDWLDGVTGERPSYKMFGDAAPHVTAIYYRDFPHSGCVFGATLGLSLRPYARGWAREVVIAVDQAEPIWTWAVADLVAQLSPQRATFAVGDTYDFGGPVSEFTAMSAFVIGDPIALPQNDSVLHLSNGDHIVLVQAFPLHRDEMLQLRALPETWREQAVARFLEDLGDKAFDVWRPPQSVPRQ